jgi:tRNA-2-methylthio-N6-dimethylallyladenosine synthase
VEAAGFDASFTFIYNSRPGTAAGRMPDDVSAIVKQERLQRLMNLTRELSAQSLAKEVGRETEVLVSGVSRKDPGNWTSRTGSNKIVHFERRGEDLAGKRVKVAITQAGSWSLKARALQVIG